MDKLAAMQAFVEIVDRGSLTRAGEALGKSLPTMVRTLQTLETSLGARLLARTTRTQSLTPEGRDFLERSRRILADVAEAEEAVVASQAAPRGPLRVSAPVLFGQQHVAPALIDFAVAHPQVEVELVLLDRVVDLVEEGIDVAIRLAPLADSSMIAVPVGSIGRVVVASPERLARDGAPTSPSDLAERDCVVFAGTAPGGVWRFVEDERPSSVSVPCVFKTNQAAVALEACAAGLGYGQFLAYQAMPLLRAHRLETVLDAFAVDPVPVNLVYPGMRSVSARIRAFLDWMRPVLRADLAALGGGSDPGPS